MGQVRHGSATTAYAVRAAIQRSVARQSRLAVMRGASFARGIEQGTGYQSQDRREVAKAVGGEGLEDWAEGAAFNRSHGSARGNDRCIPAAHAAAAGRLPLCSKVSDLLCLSHLAPASLTKEDDDNDDIQGRFRGAAEWR